jgi:lysozyme
MNTTMNTSRMLDRIMKRSKEKEGTGLKLYRCTEGKLTIGHGRNIEENGITLEEAEYLLRNDIENAIDSLIKIFKNQIFQASTVEAFVDMIINMGETKFRGFVNMISAAKAKNWEETAKEAIDSKWYRDHKKLGSKRADEVVELIRAAI